MSREKEITHVNEHGEVHMVDVSGKDVTLREAVAEGELHAEAEVLLALCNNALEKGDAFAVARVAGIQGAKRTSDIIPLCHPLPLTGVNVSIRHLESRQCLLVTATVRVTGKTGAEMEALTAVSIALLTLYDMAKSMQRDMRIENVRLRRKTGGSSGDLEFC